MGIEVKDVTHCVCKVVGFSMNTCYTFVQKHPLASSVMFTSFFLYLFLPAIFNFLLYASPIIICTIIYAYHYLKTRGSLFRANDGKLDYEDSAPSDCDNVQSKPLMRRKLSVRRNYTKRYTEWDAEATKSEHDLNVLYDALLVGHVRTEEMPKGITEEWCALHRRDSSSNNLASYGEKGHESGGETCPTLSPATSIVEDLANFECHKGKTESFSGGGGGEVDGESSGEDDDEEEMQCRDKVVEWNENDEKNLMDLGDSDLERNRRLESLIAKRRLRKLVKMQMERGRHAEAHPPPSQIAPVLIARNSPFENPNNYGVIDNLDTPGSAPSVLLPNRNPFDLPYEPHEEKPNLMADSFQQEFTVAHQKKDMFFCRHESFSHVPSFPFESKRGWNESRFAPHFGFENMTTQRPPHPNFRKQIDSGDLDQIADTLSQDSVVIHDASSIAEVENKDQNVENSVELEHGTDDNSKTESNLDQAGHCSLENRPEVEMEMNLVTDHNSDSSSPTSSEDRGHIFNPDKAQVSDNLRQRVGVFRKPFHHSAEPSFPRPIPSGIHVSEAFYYTSPTPPHTKSKMEERSFYTRRPCHTPTYSIASDMNVEVSEISSPPAMLDEIVSSPDRESLTYDGDVDKGHDSGDDELWGASFNARSDVANQALHEAAMEGDNKKSVTPITSSMPPEQIVEHDLSNNSSYPTSNLPEQVQSQSENLDYMASSDVKQVEDVGEHRSSNSLNEFLPSTSEHQRQLTEDSLADFPHQAYSEMPENLSNPPTKSAEQVTIIEHIDGPAVHESDIEELNFTQNGDNEASMPVKQKVGETSMSTAEEIGLNSGQPTANGEILESILECKTQMEENKKFSLIDGWQRDPANVLGHVESQDSLRSVQGSTNEQNISEVEVPEANQSANDLGASPVPPELVVEQDYVVSSSSSPTSVLQLPRLPSDQISFSTVDPQRQADLPQSSPDDIVRNNPSDEQTLQDTTSTLHQNVQDSTHDGSLNHQSNNHIAEVLEEAAHNLEELRSLESEISQNTNEDESSGKLFSNEVVAESSKDPEQSNHRYAETGNVENSAVNEPNSSQSKAEEENTSSSDHGTAGTDEELRNIHGKFNEEANTISKSNDPIANETQFSIRHETTDEPLKPADAGNNQSERQ